MRASFTGTPGSPTITVSAALPAVVYAGNQATNLVAQATYANKILSIPTATFRLNGTGQAALRGTVDTTGAKPVLLLAGMVRGVNLAALRLPPAVKSKNLNLGAWRTCSSWRTTRGDRFRSSRTSAPPTCTFGRRRCAP